MASFTTTILTLSNSRLGHRNPSCPTLIASCRTLVALHFGVKLASSIDMASDSYISRGPLSGSSCSIRSISLRNLAVLDPKQPWLKVSSLP